MISIDSLSKVYQSDSVAVHALRGVSLSIDNGEFVSLAGPSGSGKTTLLNLIGCIDSPSGGSIAIDGENTGSKSPKELAMLRRKKIGFVFQSFNLIPVLTAYENVAFTLSLLNMRPREIDDAVKSMLRDVGLEGLGDRLPSALSGGQQQRVAIARALVKNPSIILADEPTANLDSTNGEAVLEIMRSMNQRLKTTFIFSTHDTMVMDYAKRLVLMHDGEVVSDKRGKRAAS